MRPVPLLLLSTLFVACGSSIGEGPGQGDDAGGSGSADARIGSEGDGGGVVAPKYAELWYSVDDRLVRIEIDPADGSVAGFTESTLEGDLALGQNSLTMLEDGSLLGARLSQDDDTTRFYYIAAPSRSGGTVTFADLGPMPGGIMLEALYTDCDGRLYGMDTGVDDVSSTGNRLLRFTGDYLVGDFSFDVVSDLSSADVADIDDMGPGITDNEITDNPGFAIDTGSVYAFGYDTGTGHQVGSGGSYGVHALGGPLFDDGVSRLYLFSSAADLYELDPEDFSLSSSLGTGPTDVEGTAGWSGLAGPLTECDSGFVIE